jgi:peptidoglycan/xylan/chitin deacetylase (PgdA/CDA1 family)
VIAPALAAAAGTAAAAALLAHGAFEPNSPVFGPAIGRGPREPAVYLTFDDGPNPRTTERIVRILEREHVPAHFFMLGRHVDRYADLARGVAERGFGIGNHTYSHAKLILLGPARTTEEVTRAHQTIAERTGIAPRAFRAPHGYRNPFLRRAVAPYGYRLFGWTFGVWDTARPGAEVIRRRTRARIRPGAVLLLHDGDGADPEGDRTQTAEALPGIIEDCRTMGYEFRSLDRLDRA